MNVAIKKSIYLIVMMGIIFADCCAGEGQGSEYGSHLPPGYNVATVYHPGDFGQKHVAQMNASEWRLYGVVPPEMSMLDQQPVYTGLHNSYQSQVLQQHMEQQEEKKRQTEGQIRKDEELAKELAKQEHLQSTPYKDPNHHQQTLPQAQQPQQNTQPQNIAIGISAAPINTQAMPVPAQNNAPAQYDNSSGGGRDISATYNNSTYALQSFLKTISTKFSRTANNSSLFVFRCGNTYQDIYQEDNTNSALMDIALFNTYKQGMVVSNTNSSRLGLSIGDFILVENKQSGDTNSTNWSLSINRDECAALLAVGIALKYGILQSCLHATGVALPYMVAVPLMVGSAFMIPVVTVIGTSLVVIVGTSAALLAGGIAACAGGVMIVGGMILLPFSPLLMLIWAASRR